MFIHLSVDGHLGCSCLLAIVTSVSVNMGIQIFLQDLVYTFFLKRNIPRTEMSGSYGSSIFNILNLHTNFHSDCIILHSHQQWVHKCSNLSTPSLTLVTFCFYERGRPNRCYLVGVLICISLMISDVEHLFICLFPTCPLTIF